jgi:hypothetical protein
MEAREYPFYGVGIIAFTMANMDRVIQGRERNELRQLIHEWSERVEVGFDVTEIIFELFVKNARPEELTYERGMHYIKLGREFLTESMKEKFIFLIKDIAHSFPPVTPAELALIKKFETDVKPL